MATESIPADKTAPTPKAPAAATRPRRLRRRPLALGAVLLIALAISGTVGYNYWRNATLYISTDDALVDTTMQAVSAPMAGKLDVWQAQAGARVRAGTVLGVVRTIPGLAAVSTVNIVAPIDGTLLRVDATPGQNVSPALPLAYVADLDHLRITAYIDETDVGAVRVGQPVDITIDATGRTTYQGTVSEIIPATAGEFSLLPSSDRSTSNFTKVTQRVEVRIAILNSAGTQLYPGENASVRIHR